MVLKNMVSFEDVDDELEGEVSVCFILLKKGQDTLLCYVVDTAPMLDTV
jgi:hypothetical protein